MSSAPLTDSELAEHWARAFAAWEEERYSEAEPFFRGVLPYVNGHWNAPHFFGCFAHTLEMNGKLDESYQMRLRSLEAALTSEVDDFADINVARLGIGEFLFRRQRYAEALEAIQPSLDQLSKSRWMLLYLAARIHYRQRSFADFRSAAEAMFLAIPKGKFASVDAIMARVAADDC
jgi:tetratricopeptide (TPR) repeat protein